MRARQLRKLAGALGFCAAGASLIGAPASWAAAGDDARVVLLTSSATNGNSAGRTVHCGPGERAIGGGVGFEPSGGSSVSASAPRDENGTAADTGDGDVPRSWFSEAVNFSGNAQQYQHYAVCSASSDATLQVEPFSASTNLGGGTYADKAVGCPAGERGIGGGLDYQGSISAGKTQVEASAPLDAGGTSAGTETGDLIRFWFAEVRNLDNTSGHDYAVSAVCSASSDATVTVEGALLSAPTPKPICTGGARATAGGVIAPLVNGATGPGTVMLFSGPTNAAGDPALATGDAPFGWTANLYPPTAGAARFSVICDPPTPTSAEPPAAAAPAPVAGQAGPTGQQAAALAKCKKKHPAKKRRKCRKKASRLPL